LTSSDFYHAVTATAFSQFIQRTHGLIASIQMVHIICLAAVFALGLALALSLAGRGFESLDSLSRRFEPAIWILLALLLATGALLIIAEPVRSLPKTVFYIKIQPLAGRRVARSGLAQLLRSVQPWQWCT
jgi:protein-S-isoprenylcysteine O-methyltransferase Ste14